MGRWCYARLVGRLLVETSRRTRALLAVNLLTTPTEGPRDGRSLPSRCSEFACKRQQRASLLLGTVMCCLATLYAWTMLLLLPSGRAMGRQTGRQSPRLSLDATTREDVFLSIGASRPPSSMSRKLLRSVNAVADSMEFNRNMTLLKRALLDEYDKTTPPPNGRITVQLSLQELLEVDTSLQTITILGWWRHYWVDPRLDWEPAAWGGIDFLTFRGTGDGQEIWGPDDLVYESMDSWDVVEQIDFSVYPGGFVFVSKPQVTKLPCQMDLRKFPFDTQRCGFTLGSWSFHGFIIDIKPRLYNNTPSAVDLSTYAQNNEFALMRVETDHYNYYYTCCPEPYPLVLFTLVLRRESLTYFQGIILPLIFATSAGFLAFLTNPHASERITLGITVLLVTGVIYLVAVDMTPKCGVWNKISYLYMWSCCLSLFTLMVSVLAVSLSNIRDSVGPLSEPALLSLFLEADTDGSGTLDQVELEAAVCKSGIMDAKLAKLRALLRVKNVQELDFGDWCVSEEKKSQGGGMDSVVMRVRHKMPSFHATRRGE